MGDEGCRVYVGNLNFDTDEITLRKAFSEYGNIVDCQVITDRETGRSRGFGFVTFDCPESADDAVRQDTFKLQDRDLKISIARARNDSRGGGGGGRGRGGYRRGGGYGQRRGYGGGYGGGNRGRDGGW